MSQQPYQGQQNHPPQYAGGHPVVYAVNPPTVGQAIAALSLGICSLAFLWIVVAGLVLGIAAVIFGHYALKKIAESEAAGAPLSGRGVAIAGLITGYMGVVIGIIHVGFYVWIAVILVSGSSG